MVKINDINQASKLAFAHMKPGVLTNHVMTAAEYRAEIDAGTLYAYTWPGGVLFLRGREGYFQLSYCIVDENVLPQCSLPEKLFTEIAFKPIGVDIAERGIKFWAQTGLAVAFRRVRLTREGTVVSGHVQVGDCCVVLATLSDIEDCLMILKTNFDPLTGYIPNYPELACDIENNCVLCLKDTGGAVCGLLRYIHKAASVEIRQLALHENMRGQGLAHKLLDAFVNSLNGKKSTVWVRDGYMPAIKAYNAAGFALDGWQSVVMTI